MAIQPIGIGMVVKDMGASLRFYRLLGLDIPEGQDSEDHVNTTTPNGYTIMWDTEALVKSIDPQWKEPVGQRLTLAFNCEKPAEVDATYRRLVEAGYGGYLEPWDAFWGQRYAVVTDPDGTHVDLCAPLEG